MTFSLFPRKIPERHFLWRHYAKNMPDIPYIEIAEKIKFFPCTGQTRNSLSERPNQTYKLWLSPSDAIIPGFCKRLIEAATIPTVGMMVPGAGIEPARYC
jgi:hypothetical protein